MNSIISWVGGKKALRDLIYQRMPVSYDRYIEVFGGGGWVLFGKPPDKCMEVYNDFNSNLANLFYCVKERPMALLKELSFLPLNSRDEFVTLRKFLSMEEFKSEHLAEELEIATHFLKEPEVAEIRDILMERASVGAVKRAAAFYKIIRYSYGSGCTSYGCQPFDIRKTFTILWEANRRLKDTVIENKDFEALIRQYDRPNAFFYCDPPYYETEGHYEVVFRKEDHESKEFLLVRAGENPAGELMKEENVELRLPPELLADAKIPMDADLDIVCTDRKIVILPTEDVVAGEVPEELLGICEELGIPKEKVNIVLRMTEEGRDEKTGV